MGNNWGPMTVAFSTAPRPPKTWGAGLAEASHLHIGIKVVLSRPSFGSTLTPLLRFLRHPQLCPSQPPARASHPTSLVSLTTGVRSHCVRQRPPFLRSLRARKNGSVYPAYCQKCKKSTHLKGV